MAPTDPAPPSWRRCDGRIETPRRRIVLCPSSSASQAPGDARLWHIKGLIQRQQDRREVASRRCAKAVELAPGAPPGTGWPERCSRPDCPASMPRPGRSGCRPAIPRSHGLATALIAAGETDDAIPGWRKLSGDRQMGRGPVMLTNLRWMEGEREGFARSFDEASHSSRRSTCGASRSFADPRRAI